MRALVHKSQTQPASPKHLIREVHLKEDMDKSKVE